MLVGVITDVVNLGEAGERAGNTAVDNRDRVAGRSQLRVQHTSRGLGDAIRSCHDENVSCRLGWRRAVYNE